MPRYIDAEPLPNGQFWDNCTDTEKAKILSWILSQPTADVVEVVRCKDCEYYKTKPLTGEKLCIKHKESMERMWRSNPDDYCSCGKRKEE